MCAVPTSCRVDKERLERRSLRLSRVLGVRTKLMLWISGTLFLQVLVLVPLPTLQGQSSLASSSGYDGSIAVRTGGANRQTVGVHHKQATHMLGFWHAIALTWLAACMLHCRCVCFVYNF